MGFDPQEPRQRRMLAAALTSAGIEVASSGSNTSALAGMQANTR